MLLKLLLFISFTYATAEDACSWYDDNDKLMFKYCDHGCCGQDQHTDPCCGIPAGEVVGIVCGILVLIGIIIVTVAFLVRRRYVQRTIIQYPTTGQSPYIVTTTQSTPGQMTNTDTAYMMPPPRY